MTPPLIKLTLACPQALAEQMVEFLLDGAWLQGGFTTVAGSGHGADFANATLREKVRGRVEVLLVTTIVPAAHLPSLLAALREQFKAPYTRYWTEPIQEFGDLS
ncbi:MAG TPA: DUF3240 family protein [Rhizomicrobium sp.]|nr:DUF3240 family protein [Rhizomicrobium sp.]